MTHVIQERLSYRPLLARDVDTAPLAHQGTRGEVIERIAELGASAMLCFDGDQHVGQLQFRRFVPGLRSPHGVLDPLYWGDFAGARLPELPAGTLNLFCYHVGQLREGPERDARYQGRGMGAHLLDELISWAERRGVPALIAKAVPAERAIAVFMGGLPVDVYRERGFEPVARWRDPELFAVLERIARGELAVPQGEAIRALADAGADLEAAAEVAACVRRLRPC